MREIVNETMGNPSFVEVLWRATALSAAIWVPIAYAAYVLGKRQVSMASLLVFVTAECVACGYMAWFIREYWIPAR